MTPASELHKTLIIALCRGYVHDPEGAEELLRDYTAPLRERIKELERFATPLVSTTASATSTVIEHESIGTVLGEKLRKKHQEMRELAEIGRLAVEARRTSHDDVASLADYLAAVDKEESACDAYLAKHPTEKP